MAISRSTFYDPPVSAADNTAIVVAIPLAGSPHESGAR